MLWDLNDWVHVKCLEQGSAYSKHLINMSHGPFSLLLLLLFTRRDYSMFWRGWENNEIGYMKSTMFPLRCMYQFIFIAELCFIVQRYTTMHLSIYHCWDICCFHFWQLWNMPLIPGFIEWLTKRVSFSMEKSPRAVELDFNVSIPLACVFHSGHNPPRLPALLWCVHCLHPKIFDILWIVFRCDPVRLSPRLLHVRLNGNKDKKERGEGDDHIFTSFQLIMNIYC